GRGRGLVRRRSRRRGTGSCAAPGPRPRSPPPSLLALLFLLALGLFGAAHGFLGGLGVAAGLLVALGLAALVLAPGGRVHGATSRLASRTTTGQLRASARLRRFAGVALRVPPSVSTTRVRARPARSASCVWVRPALSRAQRTAAGEWWSRAGARSGLVMSRLYATSCDSVQCSRETRRSWVRLVEQQFAAAA